VFPGFSRVALGDFPGKGGGVRMTLTASTARQGDGRLWVIALGLALVVNVGVVVIFGFTMLKSQILRKSQPVLLTPPPAAETTVMIFPESAAAAVATNPLTSTSTKPRFARTSDDQAAPAPEAAPFIGERNTQATSDRRPDPMAPALPSQAGIEPKSADDFETTESDYQDGKLDGAEAPKPQDVSTAAPAPTTVPDPAVAENSTRGEKVEVPGKDATQSAPAPPEKLLNGPVPVDVAVPRALEKPADLQPTPAKRPVDGTAQSKTADSPKSARTSPVSDPAFKGNQRKTGIVGSISRNGRSALDVADSPLGRYQAVISRAVEQEWQRNCVRHRDFITPGFLTVRFYVESSGKVRTVQFVGEMETGEVQKGFTLNSIRDARIPAMPAALKQEFAKDPLELIFNFYF
jgi:hypothetical protein